MLGIELGVLNFLFTGFTSLKLSLHLNDIDHEFKRFSYRKYSVNDNVIEAQKSTMKLVEISFIITRQ